MQRRVPEISKINRLIGFKPTYKLTEVIADIIKYLKAKNQHKRPA